MRNTGYTKLPNLEFWRDWPALYFPSGFERCFDNIKKIKKLKFEEDWAKLRPKIVFSDNPRQNIGDNIEKSSKTGMGKNSLVSNLAFLLTTTVKV